MALTKLTTDLNNVQALEDEPNDVGGLTAAQVKAVFDQAGNEIKTYINDVLTTEIDILPATSISVNAIPTLAGVDVQTVLESVKGRIDTIVTTSANAEVAAAHTGADLIVYTSLAQRLDTLDATDVLKADALALTSLNGIVSYNASQVAALDTNTYKKTNWQKGTRWTRLPDGTLMQWGSATIPINTKKVLVNFQTAFSDASQVSMQVSMKNPPSSDTNIWHGQVYTSAAYIYGNSNGLTYCEWTAIGY